MAEGGTRVQYAAAFCVTISLVYQGMLQGWSSPVIPKLLSGETDIQISKEGCSWLASLVALGAVPGCLIAQYLGDKVGRKKTILLSAAPGIVGSVIMLFVTAPPLLYIARLFGGISGALAVVEVSIYMGEIADKRIRGALGSLIVGMMNLGNLVMYGVGPFISYNAINWICLITIVVFLLVSLWIPESPYYHLKNKDTEKAGKELLKLRSLKNIELIENDLREMDVQVQKDNEKKTSIIELFKKEYRKAVIAMIGVKMLQQWTGSLAIQAYLETIFRQTSMEMSGSTASIIYGVVQLIAGFTAALLVDKMGRKPLLLISSLGTGISLTSVGIYFYMQNVIMADHDTMASISWLPITGIIGFTIMFSIGIGNLPYVMQSELFPTNVKSAASSFFSIFGASMAFSIAKSYQGMVDTVGVHTVFWLFASMSYVGVVFVYFYVPETKGKSLEEILIKLNRKKGEKPNESEGVLLQEIKT